MVQVTRRDFLRLGAALALFGCSKKKEAEEKQPEPVKANLLNIRSWDEISSKYKDIDDLLVGVSRQEVNLAEAFLYIAKDSVQYRLTDDFSYDKTARKLEDMAKEVHAGPMLEFMTKTSNVMRFNNYFFFKKRFHFSFPDSLTDEDTINETIDTKKGICEDLTAVYVILARAAGIDARAVNVPGHVFVRVSVDTCDWNIETTARGRITTEFDDDFLKRFRLDAENGGTDGYLRDLTDAEHIALAMANRAGSLDQFDKEARFRDLDRAVKLAPEFYHVRLIRAQEVMEAKDYAKAVADFQVCARIRPNDKGIQYKLEEAQHKLKTIERVKAGLAEENERVRKDPDNYRVYEWRAISFSLLGEYKKEAADFAKAAQICLEKKVMTYSSGGKENLLEKVPHLLKQEAEAHMKLHDYDSAIKALDKALEFDHCAWILLDRGLAYLAKADTLKAKRETKEAKKYYHKAIADFTGKVMEWSEPMACLNRAKAFYELGETDKAYADLMKPKGMPGNDLIAERCYYLGLCELRKGNKEAALQLFGFAREHHPIMEYDLAYYRLAGSTH